jgi:flagellar basal-body rod modification protein FlgD
MATEPIGAGRLAAAASSAARGKTVGALDSADFLKLLVTELTHQDPNDPMSNKDILDQLSSIRALESNMSLSSSLKSLARQTQISAAAALIGRPVAALDDDGQPVAGVVASVVVAADEVRLMLAGAGPTPVGVNLDSVQEIGWEGTPS